MQKTFRLEFWRVVAGDREDAGGVHFKRSTACSGERTGCYESAHFERLDCLQTSLTH